MTILFYAPGACSLAAHIVLEEIGAPFEPRRLDMTKGAQRAPEYLAINPHGRVPALVTDQGVLTESPAILAFLADGAPEKALLPADAFARARALSLMAWLSSHVHIAFAHIFRPQRFTAEESAGAAMREKALETLGEAFGELQARLSGREWVFNHFTVVDPYILVFRRWGGRIKMDMGAFPALVAHAERVAARPAAAAVLNREGIRVDA